MIPFFIYIRGATTVHGISLQVIEIENRGSVVIWEARVKLRVPYCRLPKRSQLYVGSSQNILESPRYKRSVCIEVTLGSALVYVYIPRLLMDTRIETRNLVGA